MRMKGAAKSFDVHCVLYELERVARHWGEFMIFCEGKLRATEAIVRRMVSLTDPAFVADDASLHVVSKFDSNRMQLGTYRKSFLRAQLDRAGSMTSKSQCVTQRSGTWLSNSSFL
mmetsp:Transcript_11444/g.32757  ORF Transcript_11444/g.32757 Transcript_11444/m.32757 type:complete len:115 (-) Transcript_11444:198-542(-)